MRAAALCIALLALAAGFERARALQRSVCYVTNWGECCAGLGGTRVGLAVSMPLTIRPPPPLDRLPSDPREPLCAC